MASKEYQGPLLDEALARIREMVESPECAQLVDQFGQSAPHLLLKALKSDGSEAALKLIVEKAFLPRADKDS